jgi:hypothetical protein
MKEERSRGDEREERENNKSDDIHLCAFYE